MADSNGTIAANGDRRDQADNASHRWKATAKSNQPCRFFQTKAGCRAGDACRYQHVSQSTDSEPPGQVGPSDGGHFSTEDETSHRQDQLARDSSRISSKGNPRSSTKRVAMAKPVSKAQQANPREFQIGQVVRRFKPTREDKSDGITALSVSMAPSDPDFPFELETLKFKLNVPSDWPAPHAQLNIRIEGNDIPKGYQINIERGFDTLVSDSKTLLALLNDLDRNLERFLSSEKAQTIKIVANRPPIEPAKTLVPVSTKPVSTPDKELPTPKPAWSNEQKLQAKEKRDTDIRQLEARMGRLPNFQATSDKMLFTIPFQFPKPARLPINLQPLKEIALRVPLLYDLEPCSIKLKGVSGAEVQNVEDAFAKHARENRASTLMTHINYLTQHLPEMAAAVSSEMEGSDKSTQPQTKESSLLGNPSPSLEQKDGATDKDRPHLIFLARPPPEWNRTTDSGGEDSTESSEKYTSDGDNDLDSSADEGAEGGVLIQPPSTSTSLEKGVLLSFPNLEMTGIELLELRNLSLTVKCDRCKTISDFRNIKPTDSASGTTMLRTETCGKCASPLSARYKPELMHANSIKAGFLDLEGCTVVDMLPSTFLPTCSDCSSTQSLPGTTAVRGDTSLIVCRTCHKKMTIHIQEVKFLRVTTNDPRLIGALAPRRKKKENLGITSGTPLPDRGSCKHYAKSYRWFRFSCCNRVYACDRCHDDTESHPNEHANRMICGWCSREQNYRPEDCHFCQRSVVRKTGGGFWEGGKGTRDRTKMNRNDPRKYKRIGGTSGSDKKK